MTVCFSGAKHADVLCYIYKGETTAVYYYMYLYSKRLTCTYVVHDLQECQSVEEQGIVIQVLDKAFDVLVQKYGVIKRVYCEV